MVARAVRKGQYKLVAQPQSGDVWNCTIWSTTSVKPGISPPASRTWPPLSQMSTGYGRKWSASERDVVQRTAAERGPFVATTPRPPHIQACFTPPVHPLGRLSMPIISPSAGRPGDPAIRVLRGALSSPDQVPAKMLRDNTRRLLNLGL